jgi:hypothetical protein
VLARIGRHGFYTGSPGKTSTVGYLLGWAGVGDTDLLLRAAELGDHDLPIPAALPGTAIR